MLFYLQFSVAENYESGEPEDFVNLKTEIKLNIVGSGFDTRIFL